MTPRLFRGPAVCFWGRRFLPSIARISCLLAAALGLFTIAPASVAQSGADEVHVAPRTTPSPAPRSPDELKTHIRPFKVDVDLVLVPVTVTDPMSRLVLGLNPDNFQVYDDKKQQSIQSFSTSDVPVSLGIIFDASGSMGNDNKLGTAREAVAEFLKNANPQDEAFMITFSSRPELACDFTTALDDIPAKLIYTVPQKTTALLDAIYLGLSKMREAKNPRKALLIISDGGDNSSRYSQHEVKSLVKEADTLIYAIGIYSRYLPTLEERLGPLLLNQITEETGGRTFDVDNLNDLPDVAGKIGLELRNQYVLGYRPNAANDGKWHKIKVKLLPPKGVPSLQVYAKKGYFAASP